MDDMGGKTISKRSYKEIIIVWQIIENNLLYYSFNIYIYRERERERFGSSYLQEVSFFVNVTSLRKNIELIFWKFTLLDHTFIFNINVKFCVNWMLFNV